MKEGNCMQIRNILRIIAIGALILIVIFVICRLLPRDKHYYKMTIAQIDADIRAVSKKRLSHEEKMLYYSERFLNAPYELQCQGDGEYARYDRLPLLNFKKVNCMTYCEIVMALTLADYYEDMFNILLHIKYRDGIIGMATRNHYTMADWLPANSWCLNDVSLLVGQEDTRQLTRKISHKKFFESKGITDIPVYFPDRDVTIDYVPLNYLPRHEQNLRTGDIVALIQDKPDIFSAHMLLIVKKDGKTFFRHASMAAGKVLDVPFDTYLNDLSKNSLYQGLSFMRLKDRIRWQDGLNNHGKFVLPETKKF